MNLVFMIIQIIVLLMIGIFTISSVVNAINVLIQVRRGHLDELEKKMVFDSLVYTMLVLVIVHALQFVLGSFANLVPATHFSYRPIISAGVPYKSIISNDPWHFEALFFDCLVFSIFYFFRKRKYRE